MEILNKNRKIQSYWWEEAPLEEPEEQPASLPAEVDVAIAGCGYTGLVSALFLARAGRKVAIFDKDAPGAGCSGRNGGMVGPSYHKLGVRGLTAKYGTARAKEILGEGRRAVDFLKHFHESEGIECDLAWTGRFRGATSLKAYDELGRDADALERAMGVDVNMISKSEQHSEIGSDYFHGGAVFHMDGGLHPGKYVRELLRLVRAAGVQVIGHCAVTGINSSVEGFDVETARGVVSAREVIVATNGYTDKTFQNFRKRIIPLRSAIIMTEELGENMVKSMFPESRMHGDTRRLVYYYRPSPDGKRVMFGGRGVTQKDDPPAHARDLHRTARRIFPQLEGVKVSHCWSGTVAYTFDHAPHLGKLDGLYYAMGYCGSGVTRASYLGRQLAGQILGEPEAATAFDNLPFEGKTGYTGYPWFNPLLVRGYAFLDSISK